jgi:hypothetical protein
MSMQPIVFKLDLFKNDGDQARSQYSLLWLLEALCRVNQSHIRHNRGLVARGKAKPLPLLYFSGVHYEREKGTEEWLDIPNVMRAASGRPEYGNDAWGDCEDLACWRVAELRERPAELGGGIKAKPFAKWKRRDDGSYAYHALVLLPDGKLEDPSLTLGMTWESDFLRLDLARKFKAKLVKPIVRFAETPDVVVVDPERPGGFASNISRARALTGISGEDDSSNVAAYGYDHGDTRPEDMAALEATCRELSDLEET